MGSSTTIVEVARALGVSPSTVSRAFNEPHRLLPATVERVHRVAAEMGYTPNRHARALSTGRSGAIGLVVPDITNPFFPHLVRAGQDAAEEQDLSVFVAETNGDPERELRVLERLRPQVEGLVVASSRLPDEQLTAVTGRGRVVLVNRDLPGAARVLIASARAVGDAVTHLAGRGDARICYVGGPALSWSEGERAGAAQHAAHRLGLHLTRLRAPSGTYDEARELAPQIAQIGATAVVAFDDIVAHGVLDGLTALGLRVPDDVRLVGCDDALPIETHPRMSTIRLRTAEGIRRAVGLLVGTDEPTLPESRDVLEGTLHLRETT